MHDRDRGPEVSPAESRPEFTRAVLARLPDADRARRRRRRLASVSRPAWAILVGLVAALVGVNALPAYGADGARVAVRAVSWLVVGQSVARNLSEQLLDDLRLQWLPIATAALVLATVGLGAMRHMRRARDQRGTSMMTISSTAGDRHTPPMIDGRNAVISLLAFVVLAAALVPAMALGRGTVVLGSLAVPGSGVLPRTTLVLAGDAVIDGRSALPLVVIAGDARIEGRADDDVVAVLGNVVLGPNAVANRDVVALGGRILRHERSTVVGNVAGQELRWTGSEMRSDSGLANVLLTRVRLALLGAAAGMLLAIAAVTVVPWMVVLTAATGRGAPLQSGLIGLAGLACGPLVIVPLALSLVGVPLAAVLALALVACWWLGAASVGFLIGRRLLALRGRESSLTRAALLGGGLLGAIVGIPVVGGLALVLAGAGGAGAVLLALIEGEFGSVRSHEATMGMMVYE